MRDRDEEDILGRTTPRRGRQARMGMDVVSISMGDDDGRERESVQTPGTRGRRDEGVRRWWGRRAPR